VRVVEWIQAFLTNRFQKVKFSNEFSDPLPVTSSVIQGSTLGPILFLIFINDLPNSIKSSIRLFADDAIIYRKVCSIYDCVLLQKDLLSLHLWAAINKMSIHVGKCGIITFGHPNNKILFDYKIGDIAVSRVNFIKYLGVIFSEDLTWRRHISFIVSKAARNLHFVMRNLRLASKKVKNLAYTSIIRPCLEYACILWDPHQNYLIESVEAIQRRAARYVCGNFSRYDSVSSMICELGWDSLAKRRYYNRLKAMFKIMCDFEAYKELKLHLCPPTYLSRHDHPCKIREMTVTSDSEKYSFLPKTINDWNSLPVSVFNRAYKSPNDFVKEIMKFKPM
jgi:ribonucleases P/MRP protein subunit RPP40